MQQKYANYAMMIVLVVYLNIIIKFYFRYNIIAKKCF